VGLVLSSAVISLGGVVPAPAAASSGGRSPITVGFIYSATGPASSSYVGSQWGAEARIDAQNAAGGVNGHKIRLVVADDQSNPAVNQTAAQELVQAKGAFAVIEDSSLAFGGAKYLNQAGVPVTGAAVDGPEWNEKPYSNMFSVTPPSVGPAGGVTYGYTTNAVFLHQLGVKRLAGIVYSIQSAISSMNQLYVSGAHLGIKNCYENTSIPFGDMDFGSEALAIKSAGCDGAVGVSLLATDIAFSQALKQAGVHAAQLYYTAYDQNLVSNPTSLRAMQGDYTTVFVDFGHPGAAARRMLSDLKRYTAFPGGIPSLNITQGYEAADLMIKGLELAGTNPTRQAFISRLRRVSRYDAGGLLTTPVTFEHFDTAGILPKVSCSLYARIEGNGYVPYNHDKPVCGTRFAMPS